MAKNNQINTENTSKKREALSRETFLNLENLTPSGFFFCGTNVDSVSFGGKGKAYP